jgi:N-methylhydantoinase B
LKMSKLSPQLVEVIRNRLLNIVDEMELVVMRSAYSILWQEAGDLSNALMSKNFEIVAQAKRSTPFHLGTMGPPVIEAIKVLGGPSSMKPGDIIIQNDPYLANNHLNDFVLAAPIFADHEIVAYSCVKGHLPDVGGAVFSSCDYTASELIQEGFRIPPLKIYKEGKRNKEIIDVISANIRNPDEMIGNLEAEIAGVLRGKNRFQELLQKYDSETVEDCIKQILDNSEKLMRAKIEELEDGTYEAEDYIDPVESGGSKQNPLKIKCCIKIEGSDMKVDFTGSDEQVKAGINCTYWVAKTGVNYAAKIFLYPGEPGNDGTYRSIDVFIPKGTLINPIFPGPVSAYLDTGTRSFDVTCKALAKASPKRVIAAGDGSTNGLYYQGVVNGSRFINLEFHGGGSGAYFGKDGYNGIRNGLGNTANQRVERVESELPIQIEAYEIVPNTGGPGEFRGGCTCKRVYKFLVPSEIIVVGGRTRVAPFGLYGGKPGEKAKHILIDETGKETLLVSKGPPVMLESNSKIIYMPAGGGGIGDPLKRNPKNVLADVQDGYITSETAKNDYCVVISGEDVESFLVDYEATEKLRNQKHLQNSS